MKKLFYFALLGLLFTACEKSDDDLPLPKGAYDGGIIVLNEGNFNSLSASVSYISPNGKVENYIYKNNNNGAVLGDVLQDISFDKDRAYLVLNNSNKVVIVNRYNFKKLGEITEHLKLPRYATVADNKLFVTNSANKNITIYDVKTLKYLGEVKLSQAPEKILSKNNLVYVMQSYFGAGNTVMILDAQKAQKKDSIILEDKLNDIQWDNGKENLYAISSPKDGIHIYKISANTNKIQKDWKTTLSGGFSNKMAVDNHQVYFVVLGKVYHLNPNENKIDETPILNTNDDGWDNFYGFNVIDNKIYNGKANAFKGDGTVNIYTLKGFKNSYTVGNGISGFRKNDLSSPDISLHKKVTIWKTRPIM